MNKHWKRSLFMLLSLCIFGIAIYYVNYRTDNKHRLLLQSTLEHSISQNQAGEIAVIDISVITTFLWDRLYIFGPYTSPEKIDSVLGSFWFGSRFTSIKSSDRITLLVFTKGGHVVQYLEFPRGRGDFSTVESESGYTVEETRFRVDQKGRIIRVTE